MGRKQLGDKKKVRIRHIRFSPEAERLLQLAMVNIEGSTASHIIERCLLGEVNLYSLAGEEEKRLSGN